MNIPASVGGVLRVGHGDEPGPGKANPMTKPLIIMIGADKGGVGKTTIARATDDYLQSRRASRKLFDSEFPAGDLKRFAPSSEVVDIEKVEDQMRVFDSIGGVTLLDIRAGLLSPTLTALDRVKLLNDIRSGKMNLALLHVLGPTISSFDEVGAAARIIGSGAHHFVVKNYINETGFFEWDTDGRFSDLFAKLKDRTITVPHLPARVIEEVQKLGISFDEFANHGNSRIMKGYVRDWLDKVWSEFDRVGLGSLISEATTGG